MYIAVKEGMYRHDIRGPFETESEAIEAAFLLARGEPDAYHSWAVFKITPTSELRIGSTDRCAHQAGCAKDLMSTQAVPRLICSRKDCYEIKFNIGETA